MATDPQTLLAQANCYACFASSTYTLQLMKVALLAQYVKGQNPMTDTSPQTLLDQAKCFSCYSANSNQLMLIELALLAQIVANGGGGGGSGIGAVYEGTTAQRNATVPTVVAPASALWVLRDSVPAFQISIWDTPNNVWI